MGVNSFAHLRLLVRNEGGAWTTPPAAVPGTGSNTSAVVARTGLTTLQGEYGVGGDQSQNPVTTGFYLDGPAADAYLYNSMGQRIRQVSSYTDISGLPAGVYFIRSEHTGESIRFIKQ